jgi:hypothetical protein
MKSKRKTGPETELIKLTEAVKYSEGPARGELESFFKREFKSDTFSEPKMGID